jgi:hypothetical protein
MLSDLEYDLLAYLDAGHSVLRPVDGAGGDSNFLKTLEALARLRERGYVKFPDTRMSKTETGVYLYIGPVDLTEAGLAALRRDRLLGERPPGGYDRMWKHG